MTLWRIAAPALAAAFLAAPAPAADLPVVTFRAPMENVREAKQLMNQGLDPEGTVEVSERALLFKPPLVITDLLAPGLPVNDEMRFVVAYLQTNIKGSADQMADFWLPEERPGRLKAMRDPERFQNNRAYFARFPGITVMAMIQQPTTTTVYLGRGMTLQAVHLKRTPERFFLTTAPDNDLSLAIVEGALLTGSYD